MGNQQERSLGWLAGIIDGEGTVSFSVYTMPSGKVRISPFICIVNTDKGIMDEVWRLLGEMVQGRRMAKPRRVKHNNAPNATSFTSRLDCELIRLDGRAVRLILEPVLPYLRSAKRHYASAILAYLDSRDAMLLKRDEQGRVIRQGYTQAQIDLVVSTRTSPRAKSSEAIRRAPNVSAG